MVGAEVASVSTFKQNVLWFIVYKSLQIWLYKNTFILKSMFTWKAPSQPKSYYLKMYFLNQKHVNWKCTFLTESMFVKYVFSEQKAKKKSTFIPKVVFYYI